MKTFRLLTLSSIALVGVGCAAKRSVARDSSAIESARAVASADTPSAAEANSVGAASSGQSVVDFGTFANDVQCNNAVAAAQLAYYQFSVVTIGLGQCSGTNKPILLQHPHPVQGGGIAGSLVCRDLCEYPNCEPNAIIQAFVTQLGGGGLKIRLDRSQSGTVSTFASGSCSGDVTTGFDCNLSQVNNTTARFTAAKINGWMIGAYDQKITQQGLPVFRCK